MFKLLLVSKIFSNPDRYFVSLFNLIGERIKLYCSTEPNLKNYIQVDGNNHGTGLMLQFLIIGVT